MQNVLLSEKRTLDLWATVQFFSSLAQVRCFWRRFSFRSGLVALFLKMSERGDSWCTDSSFSSLLVKLSQMFESALLDSISQACHHPCCLCIFSYPISTVQSTLHKYIHTYIYIYICVYVLCFDTELCDQPHLWPSVTYPLCGGCQWLSSGSLPSQQCSPLLWFQRTRDAHNLYCMDSHFMKLKCKYSNILIYWFLTFISCKF